MTRPEEAVQYFADGYACAPAVFTVFGKEMGLTVDDCLKIACAFGGGMGRNQYTCGAVTGVLMALGLYFGRGKGDSPEMKELTYQKTNEFLAEFTRRHGSVNCKELLNGLNMNDPEDKKKIDEQQLFKNLCAKYVRDAAEIAEKIIGPSL
ncbi:MAG: C-GCAxxG-C-C family protein [Bacteroidales bacterium]|jgi:C_GCAxxG_C_C family probable redox protein